MICLYSYLRFWNTTLHSEPAGSAAGSKVLLFADKCDGGFNETSRGRRTRKEIHIHASNPVEAKLHIARTRAGVG